MASDTQAPNVRCPGCGSMPVREGDQIILKHGKDLATGGKCREKQREEYKKDRERAREFLADKKKHLNWISEEMVIHQIRLDRLALEGDRGAIKEFREGGMEIAAGLKHQLAEQRGDKSDGPKKQGGPGTPVVDADRGSRGKQGAGGTPS